MTRAKFGATLFSFTPEYVRDGLDRRQLLELLASLPLPQHVELVGPQHPRSFPRTSQEELRALRREIDVLGLIPSCICGFVDLAADARRPLTAAEINDELREQIAITRRAGFPILRVQHVSPETLEGLAADAERAGVVLAVEINAPMALDSPALEQTIELFDRLQSPALGFLADFGTTARRLADGLRKAYTAKGVPEEAIVLV